MFSSKKLVINSDDRNFHSAVGQAESANFNSEKRSVLASYTELFFSKLSTAIVFDSASPIINIAFNPHDCLVDT